MLNAHYSSERKDKRCRHFRRSRAIVVVSMDDRVAAQPKVRQTDLCRRVKCGTARIAICCVDFVSVNVDEFTERALGGGPIRRPISDSDHHMTLSPFPDIFDGQCEPGREDGVMGGPSGKSYTPKYQRELRIWRSILATRSRRSRV